MSELVRHPLYYFPNGMHVFRVRLHFRSRRDTFSQAFHQVEDTLYKLHSNILTTHSALLKDMFTVGNTGASLPVEGKNDAHPIFLEGEQQAVFDLFLDHIHGQ